MTARRSIRGLLVGVSGLALVATLPAVGSAAPAAPAPETTRTSAVTRYTDKNPTVFGTGGAVASVDPVLGGVDR